MDDEYVSFCVDEALSILYNGIQNQLEAIDGKNARTVEWRRARLLNKILATPEEKSDKMLFQTPTPTR